jgi:hypothetical protein
MMFKELKDIIISVSKRITVNIQKHCLFGAGDQSFADFLFSRGALPNPLEKGCLNAYHV